MTTENVAEGFRHDRRTARRPTCCSTGAGLLVAHGAERGIDQAEIRRAVMLPAGVCRWLEGPPPMCDTIRDELQQPPLPAPDTDELAELILRWCLT
jgi:hypothetical protein